MNCCNEYGHCTGGHNCPARTTPLVDASRKALAVLSLTGADQAIQDELVGAMAGTSRSTHGTITLFDGYDEDEPRYTLEMNGSTVARIRPSTVNPDPKAMAERLAACWNGWDEMAARVAELTAQRDALQARLDVLLSAEKSMVEKTGYLSADVLADNYLLVVRESKAERDELLEVLKRLEAANNQRASLVRRDDYIQQLLIPGMGEALTEIDLARHAARSVIAKHQPTAAPAAITP